MSSLPLDGVRIADLTHALSGSFCTQQLHLLGAGVVKVEPPAGDDFRERPAVFAAINAGKRSVDLDLKSTSGNAALRALVQRSDILVENFRPGVTQSLRISSESLREVNPRLLSRCGNARFIQRLRRLLGHSGGATPASAHPDGPAA